MSDLIRRQDALDALGEEPPVWYDGEDEIAERNQWRRDVNAIKAVPSAQPETNSSEIPNNSDTISKQAAIDALDKRFDSIPMEQTTEVLLLRKDLKKLPSAEPEPSIPLSWIESKIEWLRSLNNDFAVLTAGQITALVNMWKGELKEGD